MKHRFVRILIALTLLFTWFGAQSTPIVAAEER